MAPSPFRATAVTCTVLVATLGAGLSVPLTAHAAVQSHTTASSSVTSSPIDGIPVDDSMPAPSVQSIANTTTGSSAVLGSAGSDDVYLLVGDEVVDRSVGDGGLFQLFVQDRHKDQQIDMVRVHTAEDGTQTRTDRIPMPRTLQIAGLKEANTFTPGTKHFTGTATVGATITATDKASGATLFEATVNGTRAAAGSWAADADLAAGADYDLTFTQTTTDGRTTVMRDISFTETSDDAPAAPAVDTVDRRLDGGFVISGTVDAAATSVVAQTSEGTPIAEATPDEGRYTVTVPASHVGQTISVIAKTGDAASDATIRELEALPVDGDTAQPAVQDVNVLPNGTIQVIGERQQTSGIWVLDGDEVVGSYAAANNGWSFNIDQRHTGKQLDLVALQFDGSRFSATSERVALPRLLEVDGVEKENVYTPGVREFSGTAESGATITATDQDGNEVFTTEAKQSRSSTAGWTASADLASKDGYTLTFTQTTTDGRTSKMENITFNPKENTTSPLRVTSHQNGTTYTPGGNTFAGRGTPGSTITAVNQWGSRMGEAEVNTDGFWRFDRAIGPSVDYVITFTESGTGATTTLDLKGPKPASSVRVTSHQDGSTYVPGGNTFSGTATPGTTITAVNQWNTVMGETEVNANGRWSFDRAIGPNVDYVITFTESGTNATTTLALKAPHPTSTLRVSSHHNGTTYTPGNNTFAGTGTPGSTITAFNQWGTPMGTADVDTDNQWHFNRVIGPNVDYVITFTESGTDATTTLSLKGPHASSPLEIMSHHNGDTYTPGNNTFAGTATPGSTITAVNQWGTTMGSADVDTNGTWSFNRTIGPTVDYLITFTETGTDATHTIALIGPK
ncbi:hypothetical protein [Curtobacterium sp. VKM Ac-2884]|uniref:hypothetical protein n=1 Tax=Curtobacterium sp. VKM Ac-2884 TaxID=2783818 RepID=UPI00188B7F4F|nr:hypothetical protein [Curtobacterium sp. VKM Ac-2884]MBF4605105.1 hypothetical protein [Curtobacterium sp. VKM Ac-2884]